MLNKLYNGTTATYRNGGSGPIPGGSLVAFGGMCGVALEDIGPGCSGPLELSGVYSYILTDAPASSHDLGEPVYLPEGTVFTGGGDLTFEAGGTLVGYLAAPLNAGARQVTVAVAPTPAAGAALASVAALASRVTANEHDIAEIMASADDVLIGASAYQIWLSEGNEGTVQDFLDSLKGEKGDKGDPGANGTNGTNGSPGLSAYAIWKAMGNEGTQQDFLDSLKGEKGDKGDKGDTGEPGAAGSPGAKGDKGDTGLSAYQHWLAQGYSGTVQDFLDSLKGAKGDKGDPGKDGTNGTDGKDGADGADGLSAYQIWLAQGHEGTISDFLASLKGQDFDEAPMDGKPYARQDGAWVEVKRSGGGSALAATDWKLTSADTARSDATGGGGRGEGIAPALTPTARIQAADDNPATAWAVGAPATTAA